uniref:Uncharacterized protein n=1 Tax=Caenorhabditis tropicalis TaxID=1561998 RepID=A0A1I7TVI0_9PELO
MEELPRWEIKTDPETNSYREYREWKDRLSDCYGGPDGHDPCEKLVSVLAIGKEKYGEAELREKIHKISEEDRMGNEKMEELIATDIREGNGKDEIGIRIKNIKMRSMKELQDVIDKEKVATWDLMEALGFKKQKKVEEEPDVEPKPEKSKSKEPEEPKKERSKKSKISETPKPIKSTNCPPKIEPKNVKNPVQKIEISKAQDVQKPQEVVVIQKTSQEEEGKKKKKTKKKKKKRCIIS